MKGRGMVAIGMVAVVCTAGIVLTAPLWPTTPTHDTHPTPPAARGTTSSALPVSSPAPRLETPTPLTFASVPSETVAVDIAVPHHSEILSPLPPQPEEDTQIDTVAPIRKEDADEPTLEVIPAEAEPAPPDFRFASPDTITGTDISLQSIVLVKCTYHSQYHAVSRQQWNEVRYSLGTGVVISPRGDLLTAGHVVAPVLDHVDGDRIWTRQHCGAYPMDTDELNAQSIGTVAEVVFLPGQDRYRDSLGIDMALLRIEMDSRFSPAAIVSGDLVGFSPGTELVGLGFPGIITQDAQDLERFDGAFIKPVAMAGSNCNSFADICGIRYQLERDLFEYKDRIYEQTPLGEITPYFRPGFSGAPVFYRGHVIGIITHGISGDDPDVAGFQYQDPDVVLVLASRDILQTLADAGFDL